jgi:pectate lyase
MQRPHLQSSRRERGAEGRSYTRPLVVVVAVLAVVASGLNTGRPPARPPAATSAVASLGAPEGFGRAATGGGPMAEEYWVTTLAGDGPGSLRHGLETPGRRWVCFAVSGRIDLQGPAGRPMRATSDKTVDGRDADVTVSGRGLVLDAVQNVIITNLRFSDFDDPTSWAAPRTTTLRMPSS